MKSVAVLVGLAMLVLGVLGLIIPDIFLVIGRRSATPLGLVVVALVRIAIGLVLVSVAPVSASPLGLRVLGAFSVLSGLVTPLVGVERARAYIDGLAAQGTGIMRLWAVVAIAFGAFVAYAVTHGRRRVRTA